MPLLGAPQEVAKERRQRAFSPLETRSAKTEALAPLYFCEVMQIQLLRWQFDEKLPTRKWHAINTSKSFCSLQRTTACTNFKQKREGKNFCQQQTHLRGGIYAPQMADFCKSKKTDGAFLAVGCQGESKGESLGFFLGYFLGNAKK